MYKPDIRKSVKALKTLPKIIMSNNKDAIALANYNRKKLERWANNYFKFFPTLNNLARLKSISVEMTTMAVYSILAHDKYLILLCKKGKAYVIRQIGKVLKEYQSFETNNSLISYKVIWHLV